MREALDHSTLEKGDKLYIEPANFPQCFKYRFKVRSVSKNRYNDTYVTMVAMKKPGGEKILRTRKTETEELGLPYDCFSSTTQVL